MDLKSLRQILNDPTSSDEVKEQFIVRVLAKDKKAIPLIMKVLEAERADNKELISDMNMELSRADSFIQMMPEPTPTPGVKIKKDKPEGFSKNFVTTKITEFYEKYSDIITHCFKRK